MSSDTTCIEGDNLKKEGAIKKGGPTVWALKKATDGASHGNDRPVGAGVGITFVTIRLRRSIVKNWERREETPVED